MSVNKNQSHVFVIPEDRRDEQIANGFAQHDSVDARRIQIMPSAGGWRKVLDTFLNEYVPLLRGNRHTHVVLLIDFDGKQDHRFTDFQLQIPAEVQSRVFVVGPETTPETLRQALGAGYEGIGRSLAVDCEGGTTTTWGHEQLRHNENERRRLVEAVRPFLFTAVATPNHNTGDS